jgi:hypothetical protein
MLRTVRVRLNIQESSLVGIWLPKGATRNGAQTSKRLVEKEQRSQGETWVLYFRTTRKLDHKRVENKIPIGLVKDLPDKSSARAEVERLHLPVNRVDSRRGVTFADLAQQYAEQKLAEYAESIYPKAHTTVREQLPPLARWGACRRRFTRFCASRRDDLDLENPSNTGWKK